MLGVARTPLPHLSRFHWKPEALQVSRNVEALEPSQGEEAALVSCQRFHNCTLMKVRPVGLTAGVCIVWIGGYGLAAVATQNVSFLLSGIGLESRKFSINPETYGKPS